MGADRRRRRHCALQPRRRRRGRHRGPPASKPGGAPDDWGDIVAMRGHVIVCGYGGRPVPRRTSCGRPARQVVLVNNDRPHLEPASPPGRGVTATRCSLSAGLMNARAVVVRLESDADTVYCTLGPALRPDVVIVARARTTGVRRSAKLAGPTGPSTRSGSAAGGWPRSPCSPTWPSSSTSSCTRTAWTGGSSRSQWPWVHAPTARPWASAARGPACCPSPYDARGSALEANPDADVVLPARAVLVVLGTQEELTALSLLGRGLRSGSRLRNKVECATIEPDMT